MELLTFHREYCIFVKTYNFDLKKKKERNLINYHLKKIFLSTSNGYSI